MKKFTKISLIVVGIIAGLGIVCCGIATAMGASVGTVYNMAKDGEFDVGGWHFSEGVYYSDNYATDHQIDSYVNQTFDAAQIKGIRIDVDAAEINIVDGTDDSMIDVALEDGHEEKFSCSIDDNDILVVKYSYVNHHVGDTSITISLPAEKTFDLFTLETGASDVNISCTKLEANEMEISMGAGSLEADNLVVLGNTVVNAGAGEVYIVNGIFENVSLDAGIGQLTFYGKVNGNIDASCGVGELDLTLDGNENDYNYELSCGLGEININNDNYSNLSGKKIIQNEGAVQSVNLDCGIGSIHIMIE